MGSAWQSASLRSGVPALVRTHGETAVYYPAGNTEAGRTIDVIPERTPFEPMAGSDQVAPALVLKVPNTTTRGIASHEIQEGLDTILVAVRSGETPTVRTITAIVSHNASFVRIQVQ